MRYAALRRRLPRFLHRYLLDFEARTDDALAAFAKSLPDGALVLDAGAGENQYATVFELHRYVSVDLCVGDGKWDYSKLDCIANLSALPFPEGSFDACLNIVTLEHVPDPARVLGEIYRSLAPGGRFLLIAPHDWEVHQAPHDYYRYTRYGLYHLLGEAGFTSIQVYPAGGYFRLLSRRLLDGLQFFRGIWFPVGVALLAPPALVMPLLDGLDRECNFTLGYICTAQKLS